MSVKKLGAGHFRRLYADYNLMGWLIEGNSEQYVLPGVFHLLQEKYKISPFSALASQLSSEPNFVKEHNETHADANNQSYEKPIILVNNIFGAGKQIYCLYRNNIYKFDRPGYSVEEMHLQIMDLEDRERRKFERLRHKFNNKN